MKANVRVRKIVGKEVSYPYEQRFVYPYYCAVQDPNVAWDRESKTPTTSKSTLCDIYSFLKYPVTGEISYTGPTADFKYLEESSPGLLFIDPDSFDFSCSAAAFRTHFKNLCKSLDYDMSFYTGRYEGGLAIERGMEVKLDGKVRLVKGFLCTPIKIDFSKEDPTLGETLAQISKAYEKLQNPNLDSAEIFVKFDLK